MVLDSTGLRWHLFRTDLVFDGTGLGRHWFRYRTSLVESCEPLSWAYIKFLDVDVASSDTATTSASDTINYEKFCPSACQHNI